MDMVLPGHGAIDLAAGTVSFFGDGNRPIEGFGLATREPGNGQGWTMTKPLTIFPDGSRR